MAKQNTGKSIIKLSSKAARAFFLKNDSYFNLELPPYFTFSKILEDVSLELKGKKLSDMITKPRDYDGVNYTFFTNKDGKYAWRKFQLIHPVLYVDLVNIIADSNNWKFLQTKFVEFAMNKQIKCLSLPRSSRSKASDKATQVTQWWQNVEQQSISLALDYLHIIKTDITDCYPSIYTHSIAWSLHSKKFAKNKKNRNNNGLLGNRIDSLIQDMSLGQTNGLPQGSALMDFIAEMVLGYADIELSNKIKEEKISDYKILRYRDDYRIFVNSLQDGERILKMLADVLIELGLKLNPGKTQESSDVVRASIKEDKLAWLTREKCTNNFQKQLLIIYDYAAQYPNSGSLVKALSSFNKRLKTDKKLLEKDIYPIISITVDIAFKNPCTYPVSAAIISKLLSVIDNNKKRETVIEKIKKRFSLIPNTGHMQIWLQRICIPYTSKVLFDDMLCQLASGKPCTIWNNDFISNPKLKTVIDATKVIDRNVLKKLDRIIASNEVDLYYIES